MNLIHIKLHKGTVWNAWKSHLFGDTNFNVPYYPTIYPRSCYPFYLLHKTTSWGQTVCVKGSIIDKFRIKTNSLHLSLFISYFSLCQAVYLSECLSFWLSICLTLFLFVWLSICLTLYFSECLSVWLYIFLNVYQFDFLFVLLSICLTLHFSGCLSVWLSICLTVYLSDFLFV